MTKQEIINKGKQVFFREVDRPTVKHDFSSSNGLYHYMCQSAVRILFPSAGVKATCCISTQKINDTSVHILGWSGAGGFVKISRKVQEQLYRYTDNILLYSALTWDINDFYATYSVKTCWITLLEVSDD